METEKLKKSSPSQVESLINTQIKNLFELGGPSSKDDFNSLDQLISFIGNTNRVKKIDLSQIHNLIKDIFPMDSMIGHAIHKPYGYSGDFEIIDKIYQQNTSQDKILKPWDQHFHQQSAPRAVRNRKKYFHNKLLHLSKSSLNPIEVLDIACGGCRDVLEYFEYCQKNGLQNGRFTCFDIEEKALKHARKLLKPYLPFVELNKANAILHKYDQNKKYNLVWSAGLFDYLDNKTFTFLIKKLWKLVKPGGKLIIGNFSDQNPSQDFMEVFGDWFLRHRSEKQLMNLALAANTKALRIEIEKEPENINYFLVMTKSKINIQERKKGIDDPLAMPYEEPDLAPPIG